MASLDFEAEKAAFRAFCHDNAARLEQGRDTFLTLVRSLVVDSGRIVAGLSGRIKDREEAIRKFTRKYQPGLEEEGTPYEIKDHITDLVGLRLVCLYEDEIDAIGALMSEPFETLGVTNKSARIEGTESEFGYKGLHLDLRLKAPRSIMPEYRAFADIRFELQIRTIVQDSWSTLDHRIKYKKSIPPGLGRRINTLAALFELADREFRQIRDATQAEIESANAEGADVEGADADGIAEAVGHAVGTGEARGVGLEMDAIGPRQPAPLNSFRLLRIAHHFFPHVEFDPTRIDGFTAEVVRREPGITRGKFNFYLRETFATVRRYREHFLRSDPGKTFNPFTVMRHCLFLADPDVFAKMLTTVARDRFTTWQAENGGVDEATGA